MAIRNACVPPFSLEPHPRGSQANHILKRRLVVCLRGIYLFMYSCIIAFTFQPNSQESFTLSGTFWRSRARRCRRFSRPARAFMFYRASGSAFFLTADFNRGYCCGIPILRSPSGQLISFVLCQVPVLSRF